MHAADCIARAAARAPTLGVPGTPVTDRGPDERDRIDTQRRATTPPRCAAPSSSPSRVPSPAATRRSAASCSTPTGAIVAEGWHRGAGTPHAECDAMCKLPRWAARIRRPPTHPGSPPSSPSSPATTPAAPARAARRCSTPGIARVVYAISDPGHRSGGGAAAPARRRRRSSIGGRARRRGRSRSCTTWLTAVRRGRPWVTVKWASTLDGRAAAADGTSRWITGTAARQRVHEQRAASDAILTATGTVLADDPSLTARGDAGELMPHQPIPVVVGERPIPADAALRRHPAGLIEAGSRDLEAVLTELTTAASGASSSRPGRRWSRALVAAGSRRRVLRLPRADPAGRRPARDRRPRHPDHRRRAATAHRGRRAARRRPADHRHDPSPQPSTRRS